MFDLILPVLKLIGGLFGVISNVETAKIQANAEVETAAIQGTAAVEQKWWFVAVLLPAFAFPYVIYDGKAVLWDNVIMGGHGYTPPLHGSLDTINWIIVAGIFMYGGITGLIKR